MTRSRKWIGVGLLAAAMALPATAQESDLRKEVEELKKGQQEILKLLKQIQTQQPAKPAARKGPEVKGVAFNLGDNPVVGSNTAQLTILELTDYQ
jgi:protein-disulfide isomerase